MFAVLALMVASAVGGFLYSELLKQRVDGRLARDAHGIARAQGTHSGGTRHAVQPRVQPAAPVESQSAAVPVSTDERGRTSRVLGVRSGVPSRAFARRLAQPRVRKAKRNASRLCVSFRPTRGSMRSTCSPNRTRCRGRGNEHRVALEQDLGGARFTGKSFEYAQSTDLKAVCVNFIQWSSEHPHIARIVVNFGFGERTPADGHRAAGRPCARRDRSGNAAPVSQQASFVTNTKP